MSNVSKVICAAAIAAASIVSPALAAHKGKTVSAHRNGYVYNRGVYVPVPRSGYDSAAQPHDTPFSGGGF
jgi:hypothetical protein